MARARNIKPGFFKNEDLAECSFPARLCFAGLWALACREGRLEDRSKRIKGEIFPFDSIEVEPLLAELVQWSFIRRYTWAGKRYIQIVNFLKHQTPHGTERDSEIPDENGFLTVHERGRNGYATGNFKLVPGSITVKEQDSADTDTSSLTVKGGMSEGGHNLLNPDSLNHDLLNPDSLNTPQPPKGGKRARIPSSDGREPDGFEAWYALYRRKDARADAEKAWRRLNPDVELQNRMIAATKAWRWADDRTKIPLPASWIRGRRWTDEAVAQVGLASVPSTSRYPKWALDAGFLCIEHAENFGCNAVNFVNFTNGERFRPDEKRDPNGQLIRETVAG